MWLKKAQDVLGLCDKETVCWNVKFAVAPIKECDYMEWNRLSNLLISYRLDPTDETVENGIKALAESFVFGDAISLRTAHPPWGAREYSFSASLKSEKRDEDVTVYGFKDLRYILNIPCVEIEAKIPVKSFEAL